MLRLFWIQNARIEIFPHPHFQKKLPSLSLNYSRATQPPWKAPGYNFKGFSTRCPHPRQLTPATPLNCQCASPAAENSLHSINLLSCLIFSNEIGSSWVHEDSNSKHGALGHFPGQRGHDSEVTRSPFPDLTQGHICSQHKHTWALRTNDILSGAMPSSSRNAAKVRFHPSPALWPCKVRRLWSMLWKSLFASSCLSSLECWVDGDTMGRQRGEVARR